MCWWTTSFVGRQSIHRGTIASGNVLITRIRGYVTH
jgi:hypothetical protein